MSRPLDDKEIRSILFFHGLKRAGHFANEIGLPGVQLLDRLTFGEVKIPELYPHDIRREGPVKVINLVG